MTPLRERNPVHVGAIGLGLIAVLLLLAFNIQDLPLLAGHRYSAAFAEAGGLKAGDEVRVAGVKVGKVSSVGLEGGHVKVAFRVGRGTQLGRDTTASVRIKTILGQKFLALAPTGSGHLDTEIPLARTKSAYDVVEAFSDLTTTEERIDTDRLASSLDTIATTFRDSPQDVRAALSGLSRLSSTIASRDQELRELLGHAHAVTQVLSDRNAQVATLLSDGNLLLTELGARRAAIHTLLVSTVRLSQQLTGLVRVTRADMAPALAHLKDVLGLLQKHQSDLDASIRNLAPFVRVFANTLGNGRWFDTYVQNLVPVGVAPGKP